MKILIPAQSIELTALVQRCLLIAERQGFTINDIELGVSPTPCFCLVNNQDRLTISERSFSSDADIVIDYLPRLNVLTATRSLRVDGGSVFVGLDDRGHHIDTWCQGESVRAIRVCDKKAENFDPSCHMAWLLTTLSLDFSIDDGLVLARAGCSVPRETWPTDFCSFPTPILDNFLSIDSASRCEKSINIVFPRLSSDHIGLYPIVNNVDLIERLLELGIRTIQLRLKSSEQTTLETQISQAIELGRQYDAQIFINDHWQLAIQYGADGVHLGQEDLCSANLQAIEQADIKLGLSTHGYYELLRALQYFPSYIALGPIFSTTTKHVPCKPQGLVKLSLYQQLINTVTKPQRDLGCPSVAIGGIDAGNAPQVWRCGVSGLAVVGAISHSVCLNDSVEKLKQTVVDKPPSSPITHMGGCSFHD
ncbi:thiamine phosphate synthase [Vibrio ostreicida]|uniref:thiamine phosphate synthase n=1 Tax=Vibrio ostreicida TaxID=526588 RepID=UPI000970C8AE|nr:thiamine phosphate synthase [Vibrio ostreicida]